MANKVEAKQPEIKEVRWTTVKIPVEVRDRIKMLAHEFGTTEWRIVAWGISFLMDQKKEPRLKEQLPIIDKTAWYITKLTITVGAFRENPTAEKLEQVRRVARQVAERLGVQTADLVRVCEDYYRNRNSADAVDLKVEVTSTLKLVVTEMIWKMLKTMEEEERKKQYVGTS